MEKEERPVCEIAKLEGTSVNIVKVSLQFAGKEEKQCMRDYHRN